jgi:hypothetical protein
MQFICSSVDLSTWVKLNLIWHVLYLKYIVIRLIKIINITIVTIWRNEPASKSTAIAPGLVLSDRCARRICMTFSDVTCFNRATPRGKMQLEEATWQDQPRIPLRRRDAGTIFLGSRYGGRICGIFCASTTNTISFSFQRKNSHGYESLLQFGKKPCTFGKNLSQLHADYEVICRNFGESF